MKIGLTSVTFRQKGIDEIIELAVQAGLTGIEWGGDLHVPAGEVETARQVRRKCMEQGLSILSYGSYYRAGPQEDFSPALAAARELGAPVIRIWAGNTQPDQVSQEEFARLVRTIQSAADQAAPFGIALGLEYHRGTMTQTKEGALRLLQAVDRPNLCTYWQPNPDISLEEQLEEIRLLSPWLRAFHVFYWTAGNLRHPLSRGMEQWKAYLEQAERQGAQPDLILEFVQDDREQAFLEDARTLHLLCPQAGCVPAAFLCDGDQLFQVYGQDALGVLDRFFDLPRAVVTSESLEEYRPLLSRAEYLFSTWGMPSLEQAQIREYFPNLRAVFYGAGSVQAFARPFLNSGIRVFSAWGANAVPVAEYTVSQILLAGKGYFQCVRRYRAQGREAAAEFSKNQPGNYRIKVGILGAGMIGRMVIEGLLSHALEVLVYDPFVSQREIEALGAKKAGLSQIFRECQVISNHIANLPQTVGMLDYSCFSLMKPNAVFINTGRGAQVVEADLVRTLAEAPDRTALLDVTDPEPPQEDSPLLTMENVFLTPHIAGSMGRETGRMGLYMAREAVNLIQGQPSAFEVTEKMLETMA